MSNIDKLNALLRTDEAGEELASLLSELLFDTRRRNVLLVKLNEIRKELSTQVRLTRAEEVLRSIVLDARKPLTAKEITAKVGDDFRSLKHKSHASVALNSLVGKGMLGKSQFGYNCYFSTPKEAVNEQLKRRGETPQDCSPAEIAKGTGMPLAVVLDSIEELLRKEPGHTGLK